MTVPRFSAARLHLVRYGPCICATPDKAALMVAEDDEGVVMIWQYPPGKYVQEKGEVRELDGRSYSVYRSGDVQIVEWQDGTTTYALASKRSIDRLISMAQSLVPAIDRAQDL